MTGPPLAEWMRWIAEMPVAFRAIPEEFEGGTVRVRAVVADAFETLFGAAPPAATLAAFNANSVSKVELNRLQWILAAVHVLWHPALRTLSPARDGIERMLVEEMSALATVAPVSGLQADDERREELARRVLRAAKVSLPSESSAESADRLRQVDSVERRRVLAAAAEREKRSRQVREMMARKAAEEAAAKVSRE